MRTDVVIHAAEVSSQSTVDSIPTFKPHGVCEGHGQSCRVAMNEADRFLNWS